MAAPPGYAAAAQHQARQILARPPYTTAPSKAPRPLAGVLHAIGHGVADVFGPPVRWLYHHLLVHVGHGFRLAFGDWWPVAALALAVGGGLALGLLLVRRRSTVVGGRLHLDAGPVQVGEDPDELLRRAVAAEAAADYEAGVRLRFRAGLLALERRGLITNRRAQTGRQLAPRLHSATFDVLAGRHEEIVYGCEAATADDSAQARQGWPLVLAEAVPAGDAPRPRSAERPLAQGRGSR